MLSMISITRGPLIRTTSLPIRTFSQSSLLFKEKKKQEEKEVPLKPSEIKKNEKPKRPTSAYLFYYKDNYAAYKGDDKKAKANEVAVEISKAWRGLSDDQKAKYVDLAKKSSDKYKTEMEAWNSKYKKPLTGYNKFVKVNLNVPKGTPLTESAELMKSVAANWKSLSKAEKEAWKTKEI